MKDQMLTKTEHRIQIFVFAADYEETPGLLQASAEDFGYEINEQELAEELIAPLCLSFPIPAAPEINPDDFERIYGYFLS